VQASRVGGIGVAKVQRDEFMPFKINLIVPKLLGDGETLRDLAGKAPPSEPRNIIRRNLPVHALDHVGGRHRPCLREATPKDA
jgi:hypothetical protein